MYIDLHATFGKDPLRNIDAVSRQTYQLISISVLVPGDLFRCKIPTSRWHKRVIFPFTHITHYRYFSPETKSLYLVFHPLSIQDCNDMLTWGLYERQTEKNRKLLPRGKYEISPIPPQKFAQNIWPPLPGRGQCRTSSP